MTAFSLLLSFLALSAWSAETPPPAMEPVLMGYARLDQKGVPEEVRVALTRARMTELWKQAHPEDEQKPPVCVLATGAIAYRLTFAIAGQQGRLEGMASLPVAVLSKEWQQVRIPIAAGSVREVSSRPLGEAGPPPGKMSWTVDGDQLVVDLAGKQQCLLVITLALPVEARAGIWNARLPVLCTRGGDLGIICDAGWKPTLADGTFVQNPAAGPWLLALAPANQHLALQFVHVEAGAAAPKDAHLSFDQRLRVALAPGRLEWQGALTVAIQGAELREARLQLPPGLLLATVEGSGLASWRQRGAEAEVSWSSSQTGARELRATGVIPGGAAAGTAAVAARLVGAERGAGRLDLVHGADGHFLRPEFERAEPAAGADLAVRWSDQPETLAVAWEPLPTELRLSAQCAFVAGLDRLRVTAVLTLAGKGGLDALRLRLPEPWRLVDPPGGVALSFAGTGADRLLIARQAGPWTAAATLALNLECERRGQADPVAAPDLTPVGDGLAVEPQAWLFGDAGDRRLRLEKPEQFTVVGVEALAAALARHGVALRPGEVWRMACERRAAQAPALALVAEKPLVNVTASHYLIVGQDQIRWWLRLIYDVGQGETSELRCVLPKGARLVRLSARDLGAWEQRGDEVTARLTAPARQAVALELELAVALADGAVELAPVATPAGQPLVEQQVALVEEDDLGLIHLDAQGLEDAKDVRKLALELPEGVDAGQVPHRWRALRPDWRLGVKRELLATTGGVDGVATLIDAVSVIAPDGDLRGRATWHVLNRTRQQLPLALPAGVELWEARVNGRMVRPRLEQGESRLWLPIRPQRPGEAALKLELTWRQRVKDVGGFTPLMPVFPDLRIMQVLWRFVPPPGFDLSRRDGALHEALPGDAESDRARRVIEELKRLRGLGNLKDAGMQRLSEQLSTLDLELNDYLIGMSRLGGDQAVQAAAGQARQTRPGQQQQAQQVQQMVPQQGDWQSANSAVISEVNRNRAELQQEQQRIQGVFGSRAGRRKALNLDNYQNWSQSPTQAKVAPNAPPPMQTQVVRGEFAPRRFPAAWPWQDALALTAGQSLGAGAPPPGFRAASAGSLLGLDLVGDRPDEGLTLRGQGGDLGLELKLSRRWNSPWPWLALLGAAVALLAGWGWARRK